jgi:hypothetical protein
MVDRGLRVPGLTREICKVLTRERGYKTTVDRTTVYRLVQGKSKNPKPAMFRALLKVLKLPNDATLDSLILPIAK